ncbi:MAG TPA: SDR family NAD(P)-dependent oxidoreductase, partial [Pyrinomonadaceae bacterium]
MQIKDKVVVVTGGANGIGKALCQRFAVEGARTVVVADLDGDAATSVAKEIDGLAIKVDVSKEADNLRLVSETIKACGPIDLFCANAG